MDKPDWLTEEELNAQIAQAKKNAQEADKHEPRAIAARYERESGRIVVDLKNGTTFIFPVEMGQGLAGASPDDLAEVDVSPSGYGLHWAKLNVDLAVPSLVIGIFGTEAWMSELARRMGKAKSEAKAAAARENGKKGGRPKKASSH